MRYTHTLVSCLIAGLILFGTAAARAENPGVVEITDPTIYTRIVAISDVHGEYDSLRRLLRAAKVTDERNHWQAHKTLLIVTGDSIDKGPMSLGVLRFWMRLQPEAARQGGKVLVLLGNHEAEFLARPDGKKAKLFVDDATVHGVPTEDLANGTAPEGRFLRDMPLAARVGNWLFCHAGWVPDMKWEDFVEKAKKKLVDGDYSDKLFLDDDSILEKKDGEDGKKWYKSESEIHDLEKRLDRDNLYGVVFGHQPDALDIADNVGLYRDGRLFKIDSGMGPDDKRGNASYPGHLLIFKHPAELTKKKRPAEAYSIASDGTEKKL